MLSHSSPTASDSPATTLPRPAGQGAASTAGHRSRPRRACSTHDKRSTNRRGAVRGRATSSRSQRACTRAYAIGRVLRTGDPQGLRSARAPCHHRLGNTGARSCVGSTCDGSRRAAKLHCHNPSESRTASQRRSYLRATNHERTLILPRNPGHPDKRFNIAIRGEADEDEDGGEAGPQALQRGVQATGAGE